MMFLKVLTPLSALSLLVLLPLLVLEDCRSTMRD
jgi:hypothetical protein